MKQLPDEITLNISDLPSIAVQLVRRHRTLIFVGWAVVVSLALLFLCVTRRLYEANTQLLILERSGPQVGDAAEGDKRLPSSTEDYISTQMSVLKSPRVVEQAIRTVGLANLPTVLRKNPKDIDEAVRIILKKYLTVTRPDLTSQIVNASFLASSREEATGFSEALVASYQQYLERHFENHNEEIIDLMTKARKELGLELARLEAEHLEICKKNPQLSQSEKDESVVAKRLEHWDTEVREANIKAIRLRSQLELGKKLAGENASLLSIAFALKQIAGDDKDNLLNSAAINGQTIAADYVRQLSEEQQRIAERYGANYSVVQKLHEKIGSVVEQSSVARRRIDQAEINHLLNGMEKSLQSIEAVHTTMEKEFRGNVESARTFITDQSTEQNIRANLDLHRKLFGAVVEELRRAQTVGKYKTMSVSVVEKPYAFEAPVYPLPILIIPVAVVAGLVVGFGAALTADMLQPRVRTQLEFRNLFGCPVLGRIPEFTPAQLISAGHPGLIKSTIPDSLPAEAFRELRTNLELLRRNRQAQIILITSPMMSDGKSVTTSNLAISMAHSGRRVLLIDADLRRPTQHTIHSYERDNGLAEILTGSSTLDQVIQKSSVKHLDLITAGMAVENPAELLSGPVLDGMIQSLRQTDYDFVFIDAPPLLSTTDATIVGTTVDGILMVVRGNDCRFDQGRRSLEILRLANVDLLGVVVNFAKTTAGGKSVEGGISSYYVEPRSPEGLPIVETNRNGMSLPVVVSDALNGKWNIKRGKD